MRMIRIPVIIRLFFVLLDTVEEQNKFNSPVTDVVFSTECFRLIIKLPRVGFSAAAD